VVKHILINAINLTGAGAQTIGLDLIPALVCALPDRQFSIILPDYSAYRAHSFPENAGVQYVRPAGGIANDLQRVRQLFIGLPNTARKERVDICLSLGDLVPIGMPCPNIVLLHQSLLLYSTSELAGLSPWSPLKRLYLTKYFAWTSSWPRFVVQTPVMAQRLSTKYRIDRQRITVISQPVPKHISVIDDDERPHPLIATNPKPIKLLFLAAYYPHKNHGTLLAVADELRRREMTEQVQIFVTLDEAEVKSAQFRKRLEEYSDVVTNLGNLSWQQVAATYRAATALFLPTLVESYGIVYLEAMACGVPILTSDRDFARWICQDLALYFDPFNPADIVNAILALPKIDVHSYQSKASQHLRAFPKNWDEVARMYAKLL